MSVLYRSVDSNCVCRMRMDSEVSMNVTLRSSEVLEQVALDYSTCKLVCDRKFAKPKLDDIVRHPMAVVRVQYVDGSWVRHMPKCRWAETDRRD